MKRLTEKDEQGNWWLKGVPWKNLRAGVLITQEIYEKLYGALCKLLDYEESGLSPDQLKELDKLYLEKCQEAAGLRKQWIPVSEGLPDCEVEVLIITKRGTITSAMYEDGKMNEEDSMWCWNDIEYDYDEENDINYIPEGWWEYKHFNPDDVYNYVVDEEVVAWMPLPESFRAEEVNHE